MNFENQTNFYQGKVRDVYTLYDKYIVMVASDRLSAFDVVLPQPIPFKGQVLNQLSEFFLKSTRDIVDNWLIYTPHPNVSVGYKCQPYPIEIVVRGYLSGHAWRLYQSGKREVCGVKLPDNLKENDKLPFPIITPTTKSHKGHDEDISRKEIISSGLVSKSEYERIEDVSLKLFERGTEMAANRNLVLVDTKYEFGKLDGNLILIDEIHTPDSSRYFHAEEYEILQKESLPQKQLSKEFVRQWLIENNFMGHNGQIPPTMTKEFINQITIKYIELYEKLTGKTFVPTNKELDETEINNFIEKIHETNSYIRQR